MKKILLVTAVLFGMNVTAQKNVSFTAKSGDNELDVNLSEMNANAHLDLSVFKKNLSVDFGITEGKIDHMLASMQPADVYMCLEVGKITAKPVETVQKCYEKNKGKGWGVIAKEMGIKPGSKEFHELKATTKNKKGNGHGNGKAKHEEKDDDKDEGKGNGHGNGNGKGHGNGKKK